MDALLSVLRMDGCGQYVTPVLLCWFCFWILLKFKTQCSGEDHVHHQCITCFKFVRRENIEGFNIKIIQDTILLILFLSEYMYHSTTLSTVSLYHCELEKELKLVYDAKM